MSLSLLQNFKDENLLPFGRFQHSLKFVKIAPLPFPTDKTHQFCKFQCLKKKKMNLCFICLFSELWFIFHLFLMHLLLLFILNLKQVHFQISTALLVLSAFEKLKKIFARHLCRAKIAVSIIVLYILHENILISCSKAGGENLRPF